MRLLLATTLAVSAALAVDAATSTAASRVTLYSIQTPDIGSCRLKGIDSGSDNFKFYASIAAKDVASVNEGCARCIKVTKDGVAATVTAYVLDVCAGCKSGELKLSSNALQTLAIDPNLNNATASYKFTSCPAAFQSGSSVKACLMEGASNTYIPLQFYNSQKIIASANISGVAATQQKDSFFFASNPQVSNANGNTQWFKDVQVTLTSTDGETKSGSFAFGGTSGCATSTFQFSAASTADGQDDDGAGGSSGSGGSNTGVIVGAIAGAVAALIIVIGSVIFVRRRRASKEFENARHDDPDQQYLSPTAKPHQPRSPERPTYADTSLHNSTDDPSDHDMPDSPTVNFDDAATPAAAASVPRNVYGAGRVEQPQQKPQPQYSQPPPQLQQQQYQTQYTQQQQQRQAVAAAAPKVAHQTYVAPTTYSYSKPVTNERAANNTSFRSNGSARAVPTFSAPVLPKSRSHSSDGEEGEGRSSFDIDDLRETEELKSRERFSSLTNDMQSSVAPHSSESAYAVGSVTSPQSYVRATSLRRNSTKVPDRPAFRFTSSGKSEVDSLASSGYSERDSYASENYGRADSNLDTQSSVNPNTGSFRDTSSGYSRESLGILGYPHAKKPRARNSITEAQL